MTDCGDVMLEVALEMERGTLQRAPTAQLYKLDDYRRTPRRLVQHEISMGNHAGREPRLADEINAIAAGHFTARGIRERNLAFEKWKEAFLQECATRKD